MQHCCKPEVIVGREALRSTRANAKKGKGFGSCRKVHNVRLEAKLKAEFKLSVEAAGRRDAKRSARLKAGGGEVAAEEGAMDPEDDLRGVSACRVSRCEDEIAAPCDACEQARRTHTVIGQALCRVSPPKGEFMWIDLSSFPHRCASLAETCGEHIQADASGRHFLSLSDLTFLALSWLQALSLK